MHCYGPWFIVEDNPSIYISDSLRTDGGLAFIKALYFVVG